MGGQFHGTTESLHSPPAPSSATTSMPSVSDARGPARTRCRADGRDGPGIPRMSMAVGLEADRRGERCLECIRQEAVRLDPCSDIGRDPTHRLQEALVVLLEVPLEKRFVMGDPVSKLSQAIQPSLHRSARPARKRLAERRTPERPVVVGFAAAVDMAAPAQETDPEAQRHRRHELSRARRCRATVESARYDVAGVTIEPGGRVREPPAAVSCRKPGMHGVAQGDFECLQRSMERGSELHVSRIVPQSGFRIALSELQVGLHPLARENLFKRGKGVDIRRQLKQPFACNPPGPPLRSACARGSFCALSVVGPRNRSTTCDTGRRPPDRPAQAGKPGQGRIPAERDPSVLPSRSVSLRRILPVGARVSDRRMNFRRGEGGRVSRRRRIRRPVRFVALVDRGRMPVSIPGSGCGPRGGRRGIRHLSASASVRQVKRALARQRELGLAASTGRGVSARWNIVPRQQAPWDGSIGFHRSNSGRRCRRRRPRNALTDRPSARPAIRPASTIAGVPTRCAPRWPPPSSGPPAPPAACPA